MTLHVTQTSLIKLDFNFYLEMASFQLNTSEVARLEHKIKHCEVTNIPINLTEKIDEGSYATVFKIQVRNKPAAVKVLKKQFSKRKILEVSIKLQKLKHPNVVRFRGYSVRPSAIFFEFCEVCIEQEENVHNIAQLIEVFNQNNHFVLKERIDILLQSARGLRYLHDNNVIHKDFKPANLLVSGSLANITVKVADFDDIVDLKNTMAATMTKSEYSNNNMAGMTMTYFAPEIVHGPSKTITKMSDVYSWAISGYEILCNKTHHGPMFFLSSMIP